MTTVNASFQPVWSFRDNNNNPLAGGFLYSYVAGTTTPQATYTDSTGTVQNTNPIVLNARGETANTSGASIGVWIPPNTAYKFVLQDSLGNQIWSLDNYQVAGFSNIGTSLVPATTNTYNIGSVSATWANGYFGTQLYINGVPALNGGAISYWPQTAAELSASVTPTNYGYPAGYFRRYGAVGDGSTNDFTAISNAFAVIKKAGGGSVYGTNGDTYYLGTLSCAVQTNLLTIAGLSNCVVNGNGCTFKTNTNVAGSFFANVFYLQDPNNVTFKECNFTDSGFDQSKYGPPSTWQAANSIAVTTTTSTNVSGINVSNCVASNTGSLFAVIQGSGRVSGININGCSALNVFYGTNFQDNGDGAFIRMYVLNPIRAYFPYGITSHDVDLLVRNDGTNVNASSNALCDIKRYNNDTKDIKLRLTYIGATSNYGSFVNLETQPTSGTAIIDGIDIDLRMGNATFSGTGFLPVQIRSYSAGGVLQNPSPDTFSRITLRGDFDSWPQNITTQIPINIASVPGTTRGTLSFPAGLFSTNTVARHVFPGFAVQTKANTYLQSMAGDLTTANTGACDARTIDCSGYLGTLFVLRVTVYAQADYLLGSTSQTYGRYTIVGYNSAGTVTISSTNTENTYSAGTASVIAFAASGNNINASFTNYNSANAMLRMEIEHLGKFL